MNAWLLAHLVAVAALAGVGWVVQLVVYPAFRLVDAGSWPRHHAAHRRAITVVVAPPWLVQGVTTAALLLTRPAGLPASLALAALGLVTVGTTVGLAVPAHDRMAAGPEPVEITRLLRANLARTLAWTAAAGLATVLVYRSTR